MLSSLTVYAWSRSSSTPSKSYGVYSSPGSFGCRARTCNATNGRHNHQSARVRRRGTAGAARAWVDALPRALLGAGGRQAWGVRRGRSNGCAGVRACGRTENVVCRVADSGQLRQNSTHRRHHTWRQPCSVARAPNPTPARTITSVHLVWSVVRGHTAGPAKCCAARQRNGKGDRDSPVGCNVVTHHMATMAGGPVVDVRKFPHPPFQGGAVA